jgi:ribosomal protein S18 acetylase RimI-like enzyme
MKIREFKIQDHEAVTKLWQGVKGVCNCDKCAFLDSKPQLERYLARNAGMSFVAVDNDEAVGVILCGHDGRTGLIYRLTVSESCHRKGIGRQLVDSAIAALKSEGIINVKAFVLNDNPDGQAFWEKIGFAENNVAVTRFKEIV